MSIRTWITGVPPNFITRSQDTGYYKVVFAKGRYVAVGGQLNPLTGTVHPSEATTIGGPVTAKLCAWSTDGVKWQDSGVGLPAAGTTVNYNNLSHNGTLFCATAGQIVNGAWRTNKATSADGGLSWTNATDTTILVNSTAASPATGRFLFIGSRPTTVLDLSWNTDGVNVTANLLAYNTAAVTQGMSASTVTPTTWVLGGPGNLLTSAGLGAQGAHVASNWTARTVPWGGITGGLNNQRYLAALENDGSNVTALVSDTTMATAGDGKFTNIRIYRSINNGVSWTGPYMLPYDPAKKLGPYWDIAWNGRFWCVVGYGAACLSMDGITWTPVQIPAGLWRSITSDGDSFVAVSTDGYRIKMKFDEATIVTSANRMRVEEFFSEIIEEVELAPETTEGSLP